MSSANPLIVKITRTDNSILLESQEDKIEVWVDDFSKVNSLRADFAAWLFLPIAMRAGRDLHIEGCGSEATVQNARRMAEIWESWIPYHFSSINVVFKSTSKSLPEKTNRPALCFYSGGVDSTHAILQRHLDGKKQALLTVHGMDYKVEDSDRFDQFKSKTDKFSKLVGIERIFVRTNAYSVYNKNKINLPNNHVSHIFALGGAAFLFSEQYGDFFIAADSRTDQQFITYPWGSNSTTNIYFDDGSVKMVTLDDHLTRTEKIPLILSSVPALDSVSFCTSYAARPNNCGSCEKCMRTKLMFFAGTGEIPEIFINKMIPQDWYLIFDMKNNFHKAFLLEIIVSARGNGRLKDLPGWQLAYSLAKEYPGKDSERIGFIKRAYRKLRGR